MAWNPSPEVAVARDAAKALGADQVVIVYIKNDTDQFGTISFGKTKQLCDAAKPMGDVAHQAVGKYIAAMC